MFDPYHLWLGIPKTQRPPTLYQLLGIAPNEQDVEVIEEAALRQTSHVRGYQTGVYAAACNQLLTDIARARITLLDPAQRAAYDADLAKNRGDAAAPAPSVVFEGEIEDVIVTLAESDDPQAQSVSPVTTRDTAEPWQRRQKSRDDQVEASNRRPGRPIGLAKVRPLLYLGLAAGVAVVLLGVVLTATFVLWPEAPKPLAAVTERRPIEAPPFKKADVRPVVQAPVSVQPVKPPVAEPASVAPPPVVSPPKATPPEGKPIPSSSPPKTTPPDVKLVPSGNPAGAVLIASGFRYSVKGQPKRLAAARNGEFFLAGVNGNVFVCSPKTGNVERQFAPKHQRDVRALAITPYLFSVRRKPLS